jgi:hypothetical protein
MIGKVGEEEGMIWRVCEGESGREGEKKWVTLLNILKFF